MARQLLVPEGPYGDSRLAENVAEKDDRSVPQRAGDCRSEKGKKP
jgi:hypothetical protein